MIEIALHTPSGMYRHINAVNNGKRSECVCSECKDPLIAHQGEKQQAHFKHTNPDSETRSCYMTQLHRWARHYIGQLEQISFVAPTLTHEQERVIPVPIVIAQDEVMLEKAFGAFRVDIFLESKSLSIAVEVKVAHPSTPNTKSPRSKLIYQAMSERSWKRLSAISTL
jgi:hypothetical protein